MPLTKRTFIKNALCLSAGLVLPVSNKALVFASEQDRDALFNLASDFYFNKKDAAFIGYQYLSGLDPQPTADELFDSIFPDSDSPSAFLTGDRTAELKHYIRAKISDDFDTDKTVTIHNWILSYTEVRLCALTYANADVMIKGEVLIRDAINRISDGL
jgi:hypothetical protein